VPNLFERQNGATRPIKARLQRASCAGQPGLGLRCAPP